MVANGEESRKVSEKLENKTVGMKETVGHYHNSCKKFLQKKGKS